MKRLLTLAAFLAAFCVQAQSPVRRIDSLTNLLVTVDPDAVGADGTVVYLVAGYYTPGDWGSSARQLTASTTVGTTNEAHILKSLKNPSYYWRSADAQAPVQDIRWWGSVSSDGLDDSTNIQSLINYAAGTKTVFFPVGTWRLESTLTLPYDYQEFDGAGFNANLQVAHNGNGWQHLGVTNGEPRRYSVRFRNFRMTSAAGFAPAAAFHVNDCSYFLWQTVDVTQGSGDGFARALYTFGHYDTRGTNLIFGGNWGNTIRDCTWYNRAGPYYVIHGDGGPNLTGGPNDLRILDSYISGGLSGSPSNGAAGAVFVQNANAIRIINNDFEQYSTNSVRLGTNLQSAIITGNRFESLGASTAARRCIKLDEYNVVGQVISGNMMWLQGGLGSITRIAGPSDSKRISSTILDPSFEGPNQILANVLLVGTNLDGSIRDFGPSGTKLVVMDTDLGHTNSVGVQILDGTNNPSAFLQVSNNGDGTGTNSRVNLTASSSIASLPLYIVGNITNAVITATGSSILGMPETGNAFTAYGSAGFGSDPQNPFIDGWSTTPELVSVRGTGTNRMGFWAGTIDGSENRRVELYEDPVTKVVTLIHGYTTGGGTTRFIVGTNVVLSMTALLMTINTNLVVNALSSITVGGEAINDFSGTNLLVSGGKLNVVGGAGSGLNADLLDGFDGAYYLDRANHTGSQSWTTITGLGDMALIDDAVSDGNIYGRKNGAWAVVTNSGGGGGSTNGTSVSIDGGYQTAINITNSSKIDPTIVGSNLTFTVVPLSLQTNDIDTTFYTWVNSKGGSVYADGTITTNLKSSPSIRLDTTGSETTLSLSNTAVTAGSYTLSSITVDAQGRITSASNGSASTNSGSVVSLDGTQLSALNLTNSTQIDPTLSGTNLTYSIVPNSLTTNEITAAFFNWIDSQGGGSGGDIWGASNNLFTATNTFTGAVNVNVLQVTNIILINPIGVTAVGTNVADAQDELQLTPGTYTMAWDLDLQQLSKIDWTNGVMAWHNSTNITNITSTALGRSMLAMSSTNNGRDILQVGGLNQAAYSAAWDGVTNMTPTLNDIYDKIESLPGGSNSISSWNTNYFSVTGGYLDWIGGSTGGGSGGVDWIGANGVGTLTNGNISTNIVIGEFYITTNKVPTVDGRYLEGSAELALTNTTGSSVSFNFIAQVNGTPILRAARALASASTLDLHGIKAKLVRESSTTASFYALGERHGATVPAIGQGSFGASGGDTLLLATNIAYNWGISNTLTWLINIDQTSGAVNLTNTGVQRYSSGLYNPGSAGSGSSSGVTNFTVNGVSFLGPIITNTATVTIATNANGHLEFTAAGGGSSDKTFVGGNPVTNANFVSSVNGTVSIASVTNVTYTFTGVGSATNGYLYKSVDVFTNYNSSTYADVFNLLLPGNTLSENGDEIEIFTGGRFINGSGSDSGYTWDFAMDGSTALSGSISEIADDPSDYLAVSFSIRIRRMSSTSVFIMLENIADHYSTSLTTNEIGRLRFYADYPVGDLASDVLLQFSIANLVADPDVGMNLYGLTILKLGSAGGNTVGGNVYTSSNNVFTGSNTFSGALMLGTTNVASALAGKQASNANLNTVANLTSGTSTNFLAGDGTFKQVTTNMIPGLNAALAGGGLNWSSGSTIARFSAIQGEPPASTYATFSTRNALGCLDYDPATDEAARFRFIIPAGYTLTNATVVVQWTTTATSGNAVWQARFWKLTGSDIDSDSFGPAVTQTTACSGTAGTIVTSTITPVGMDDATASQEVAMEITRLGSSGSDTINSNDLNLMSVEVRTP